MVDHIDPPDTRGGHVLAMLSQLERRLGESMGERMAPHGIVMRGSHARLLHLVPTGGARPTELAAGWISKQAVGKRIQEMVEVGLLSVGPDPGDGRASIVRRTPDGDQALLLVLRELAALEDDLARQVGERRYRTFRAVLGELVSTSAPDRRPGGVTARP